jgi:hypothetical protein
MSKSQHVLDSLENTLGRMAWSAWGWIRGKNERTFSHVVVLVAIGQLNGLVDTSRRARGDGGAVTAWVRVSE